MRASYPVYESYKDSGVEWIGKIPTHWELRRSKYVFTQRKEFARKDDVQLSATQSHGVIPQGEFEELVGRRVVKIQTNLEKRKHVEIDDFVISMRSFQGGLERALVTGCIRSSYVILRQLETINPDFFGYLFKSPRYVEALQSTGCFIRDGQDLNFDNFSRVDLFLPPIGEQRAIAAFLDEKCAKVDEAVRIKEEQIALLRERRQILIQQAVTRGLNPNAPMKDSGIDWIGQIPAHWEVRRGKHLFREVNERSDEGTEELLSVSHMTGVTSRSEKNVSMFMAEDYSGSKLCQPGDVVINTMWAWMGALGVSDLTGIVSPSYGVYRPRQGISLNRRFVEFMLRTTPFIEQYNRISTGLHSSRLRLYPHMFLGLPMVIPSREEQDIIAENIENDVKKIADAITIKESQITALKEYRTTLINAAVTGKIKVA
ncbi:type I restriction enzyme, S subunit [Azospirillum sp. RU38E]|nr:type I restriction enzyme, S subunit [Azospirillum sp. RU38E]SNT06960.1 type I restriction enzyme, S subunit [Azospirillum sp. RU37A]